ncbi:MAG: RNA polymerase sigma factor [Pseudomonadota bacterium]
MSANADQGRGLRRRIIDLLPRLGRYAYALTGSRADADDAVQATVERLLARGVPDGVDLEPWALRVCRNLWIDETRRRAVRRGDGAVDEAHPALSIDGEREALEKTTLKEARDAMNDLPVEQREALALVAIDGRSYAETAEILGAPIGTVMSRIARARAALAARFAEEEQGP